MEKLIIFIITVAILIFLTNMFIKYNKKYKKAKLEREKEKNRFETLSSIKNKSVVTIPISGYYIKCTITNNDTKNQKIFISYNKGENKHAAILKYKDTLLDDIETINPNLFEKVSLKTLKEKLEDAVLNERYEEAERLRNEINSINK